MEKIQNERKEQLFLLFNLIGNAVSTCLLFAIPYSSGVTSFFFFLAGLFEFSTLTLFYIIVLNIAKDWEAKNKERVLCSFTGIIVTGIFLG